MDIKDINLKETLSKLKSNIKDTIVYQLWLYKKFNESIIKEEWELLYKLYMDNLDFILDSLKQNVTFRYLVFKFIEKHLSGFTFPLLIYLKGFQLFGSAKYQNEVVLKENEYFKLTYIPSSNPSKISLFHVGGILPYSDRIFRFLPEINFFDRFLESGISLYAMELKGNKFQIPNYNKLTMETILDTIEEFSNIAFEHNQNKKMILEGYCGLGIQALSYLMYYPDSAEKKFSLLTLFVAPIDGKCSGILADDMNMIPNYLIDLSYFISNIIGEVPFFTTQTIQDLTMKSFISKTYLGLYYQGWKKDMYHIEDIWNKDLLLEQKKELAGNFWISPLNGSLYPIPLNLAKFYTRLYKDGIQDGVIPFKINEKTLNISTILEKTTIKVLGFYGAQDKLVHHNTANVLKSILDYRYQHIVHNNAGHISYILTPESWNKNHNKALNPNPIEAIKKEFVS